MSKKHPSTEEVESEHGRDRLEGETVPQSPESPSTKEPHPDEPWDTPEFHDQVRTAGFPSSYFGDSAFMSAAWKLTGGTAPPPPPP
jgi:hypothetical protein